MAGAGDREYCSNKAAVQGGAQQRSYLSKGNNWQQVKGTRPHLLSATVPSASCACPVATSAHTTTRIVYAHTQRHTHPNATRVPAPHRMRATAPSASFASPVAIRIAASTVALRPWPCAQCTAARGGGPAGGGVTSWPRGGRGGRPSAGSSPGAAGEPPAPTSACRFCNTPRPPYAPRPSCIWPGCCRDAQLQRDPQFRCRGLHANGELSFLRYPALTIHLAAQLHLAGRPVHRRLNRGRPRRVRVCGATAGATAGARSEQCAWRVSGLLSCARASAARL